MCPKLGKSRGANNLSATAENSGQLELGHNGGEPSRAAGQSGNLWLKFIVAEAHPVPMQRGRAADSETHCPARPGEHTTPRPPQLAKAEATHRWQRLS